MFNFFKSKPTATPLTPPQPAGNDTGVGAAVFGSVPRQTLEADTQARGQDLLDAMRRQSLRLSGMRKQVADRLLDWAM